LPLVIAVAPGQAGDAPALLPLLAAASRDRWLLAIRERQRPLTAMTPVLPEAILEGEREALWMARRT
jgi:hypothetical protein